MLNKREKLLSKINSIISNSNKDNRFLWTYLYLNPEREYGIRVLFLNKNAILINNIMVEIKYDKRN